MESVRRDHAVLNPFRVKQFLFGTSSPGSPHDPGQPGANFCNPIRGILSQTVTVVSLRSTDGLRADGGNEPSCEPNFGRLGPKQTLSLSSCLVRFQPVIWQKSVIGR